MPGATFFALGLVVPPEPVDPPPQDERPTIAKNRIVEVRTTILVRLRLLTNGNPSKMQANSGLMLLRSRIAAVVCDWVAMVRVKDAGVFPVRFKLEGLKLQDAFAGKLLHVKETVPE